MATSHPDQGPATNKERTMRARTGLAALAALAGVTLVPTPAGAVRHHSKPPAACVTAIRDYQRAMSYVVAAFTAASGYPPLITTAYKAGLEQTAGAGVAKTVIAKEGTVTATVQAISAKVDALAPKAKAAARECEK